MTDHPQMLDAGPYVIDALAPPDRAAFEEHLSGCVRCRQEVAELAGVPALLDLVPADVAAALAEPGPQGTEAPGGGGTRVAVPDGGAGTGAEVGPPPSVLRALVRAAHAEEVRSRRRRWAAGVAAAAAVVAVLAVGWSVLPWSSPVQPSAAVALAPVPGERVPVDVDVALTATDWGTRLEVTCAYRDDATAPAPAPYGADAGYALVVTDSDGTSEQVATWGVVPGHDVVVPAATRLEPAQIARIDLRTLGGDTVLSAEP